MGTILSHRFASNQNFLTPLFDENGKALGPKIYEDLVTECYYISKYIHTSFNELLDVTPADRALLLKNISAEAKKNQEQYEKAMENIQH